MKYFLYAIPVFLSISCASLQPSGFDKSVNDYKNEDGEKLTDFVSVQECKATDRSACIQIGQAIFYVPYHECSFRKGEWSDNGVKIEAVLDLPNPHGPFTASFRSSTDKTVHLLYSHSGVGRGHVYGVTINIDPNGFSDAHNSVRSYYRTKTSRDKFYLRSSHRKDDPIAALARCERG